MKGMISDKMVRQFRTAVVFVPDPGDLKKGVFTVTAKDNVDSNASSSTATRHYHGASMTIMQYPTSDNEGSEVPISPSDTSVTCRASSK